MGAIIKSLLLVLPIPFILVAGNTEYGADGLANRLTPGSVRPARYSRIMDTPGTCHKDSVSRVNLLELVSMPESFYEHRVKITAMVSQIDIIPGDYLYCFRYVMVCCAADAMPVGIFIDKPDSFVVEKDAWYEIEGTVYPDSLGSYFVTKMNKVVMRSVPKPKPTWLYPG